MAQRMQQRRGTASQWTSANTVLAAGEIGFETDTNQFKMGDGVTAWSSLSYFKNFEDLDTSGYIKDEEKGANNGVATLDGSGKLTSSQLPTIDELAQDAINTAIIAGSGIVKDYDDTANQITIAVSGDISTTQYVDDAISTHESDTTNVHGIADTSLLVTTTGSETLTNKTLSAADNTITVNLADVVDVTASASELNILDGATLTTTELNYVDGVTSAIQDQLDAKANLSGATFTGDVTVETNVVVEGNLTVSGTTTTIDVTNLDVTDPLIYLASNQFDADVLDIGIFGAYGDSNPGHVHTGLVRDASDGGKWKLVSGAAEPTANVIDFTGVTYDTIKVGAVETADITATGDVDFSAATVTGIDALPSQSGNNGKYLTTDGTTASWATLNASPAMDDLSDVAITSATTNDVVYYNGSGWVNKNVAAIPTNIVSVTTGNQSSTVHSPLLADAGKVIEMNFTGTNYIELRANNQEAFPIGTQITILQTGVGQTIIGTNEEAVVINATPGKKLRARWSSATLLKRDTDTWVIMGDLTA